MKAAFGEVEISPPLGTKKIGWLKTIVPTRVADPLFARAAVLESGGKRLGFIALDTLGVDARDVADIRRHVAEHFEFAPADIMVSATHNHGGPAVYTIGEVERDDRYARTMVERVVEMFAGAVARLRAAEAGFGRGVNFEVTHNRRIVMREGIVRTH